MQIVDSVGVRTFGIEDQLYGPATNRVSFAFVDPDVDAISRFRGHTQANRGSAWFGGDLFPAGDDYLLYEAAEAFLLPAEGTAMTPGEANTGNATESPLVSIVSITPNLPVGTVTVTFSGPISQLLAGDGGAEAPGGAGITITDTSGVVIPTVDIRPAVTGRSSNSLTLSFTGSAVVGGQLPPGDYQLNFVGNGLIANGRAVAVAPAVPGDYSGNGIVDTTDYVMFRKNEGQAITLNGENPAAATPGMVDQEDYDFWRANFGNSAVSGGFLEFEFTQPGAALASGEEPALAVSAHDSVLLDWQSSATALPTAGKRLRPSARNSFSEAMAVDPLLLVRRWSGARQRSHEGTTNQTRRDVDTVDEFFSSLGNKRSKFGEAVEKVACPV